MGVRVMATQQAIGKFVFDRHENKCLVGDTEIIDWLLEHFKQGSYITIYATQIDNPKEIHQCSG